MAAHKIPALPLLAFLLGMEVILTVVFMVTGYYVFNIFSGWILLLIGSVMIAVILKSRILVSNGTREVNGPS